MLSHSIGISSVDVNIIGFILLKKFRIDISECEGIVVVCRS